MNQHDVFDLLLSTCSSPTQLRRRANLVKSFYEQLVFQNPRPKPQDFFTDPLDWQWFLTYQSPLYQALNDPSARSALANLDRKIKSSKYLTVFTAVQIPEDHIDSLTFRLRQESGSSVLIENRVDPSVIGGCVIIKDGQVKDYSLRNKINSVKPQILRSFQEATTR